MYALYNARVLAILGGFRNSGELAICEKCYYQHLSPEQAVQVILNNR